MFEPQGGCDWWKSDFNEYEYCLFNRTSNVQEGMLNCRANGGALAIEGFRDATTYNKLYINYISKHVGPGSYLWGARHNYRDNVINAGDGTSINWQNYRVGEPNSSSCLGFDQNGYWFDQWCSPKIYNGGLCERSKGKL